MWRVHFVTLNTEANYDFLRVYDVDNVLKYTVSGNLITSGAGSAFGRTDGWAIVPGSKVRVELVTDSSVVRYGYRGGYYGRGYRYNRGAAVGAGIAAGALGALAAGALLAPGPVYAAPPPPVYVAPAPVYAEPDADAIAYCSRRFRSYDPSTGTYIASGGVVRACP